MRASIAGLWLIDVTHSMSIGYHKPAVGRDIRFIGRLAYYAAAMSKKTAVTAAGNDG